MIKKLQKRFNNLSSIENSRGGTENNINSIWDYLGSSYIQEDKFVREISNGFKTSFCTALSDMYIFSQFYVYVTGIRC